MMLSLLVTAAPALCAAPLATAPLAPIALAAQDDANAAEFQKRLATAGNDVAKLMELAAWCDENKLRNEKRDALKKVLEVDPEHEEAHKGLRHHNYDGKWFETYAELSAYKRDEAERMREKGLERYKDEWVAIEDVPYLRLGWVKDESGKWVSQLALDRAKMEADLTGKGWKQQTDLVWVAPEDFHYWDEGKWKCGDQWLSTEEANQYHSNIATWWTIPGQHFIVATTTSYDTAWEAANQADQTYDELVRLFGLQPTGKPRVVVLNGIDQYNTYANGDPASGILGAEAGNGYSSCHYAFFGEIQFQGTQESLEYMGGGVGYWNAGDPNLAPYGKHSVRHAAAHSYIEAIDPSLSTISKMASNQGGGFPEAEFWAEKKIPRWLRYGAASYVERYYQDAYSEDPWWPRRWALQNLAKAGEIEPMETIYQLTLTPGQDSNRAISQAGLVVSFILDGKCPPVIGVHRKLKAMLTRGQDTAEAVAELQQVLIDNREAFDTYVRSIQEG